MANKGSNGCPLAGPGGGPARAAADRARTFEATIDLLAALKDFTMVALFSPEHGIRGILDEKVHSAKDEKAGWPSANQSKP